MNIYKKTAEWNTVPNPYKLKGHNNIKFHWYKKAHVRNAWDNTDMHWSQAFSAYDAVQTGGKTLVSGTATVNGVHFYIIGDASQYEMAYHGYHDLKTSAYFEQPKIGYVTKSIPTYDVGTENSLISNDGYEGMVLSEGIVDIPAKQTILIPSHHDPVELFGTEYVPIIFTNHGATGGTLIKYSDFKKYVKSGEGHKFLDNGYINYQKNNYVYSKENDVKYSVKYESRKLKSAKRRKAYETAIISDLKYDAKMQHKHGLA